MTNEFHVEIDGIVHIWSDAQFAVMNPYSTRCGLVWYGSETPGRLHGTKTDAPLSCKSCRGSV